MQTVLLAAGQGTRMRPLTDRRPKPLLPVAEQPLAAHTMDAAIEAGASRFIIVVGYEADQVRETFGDRYEGVPITYADQGDPEGTADAVRAAVPHLEDGPFAVVSGDNRYDHASMAALFEAGPAVGAYTVSNPQAYGVLDVQGGTVDGAVEKPSDPPSDLINAGAYVFPAAAKDYLDVPKSARGEYELTDVLERVCQNHAVTPVRFERWLDVGRPWELLAATEWHLEALEHDPAGTVHEAAHLEGPVYVHESAEIRADTTVEGPVHLGPRATVGPGAYVRGSTYLGPDTRVGHGVEIKNSILMEGAAVPHLSYVGDSILGRDVNLGAGTIVANLRHDDEPVHVRVKGEQVSTDRRKFGVVLGDGVKTGIDTTLNAGVTLPTAYRTQPNETILSTPES